MKQKVADYITGNVIMLSKNKPCVYVKGWFDVWENYRVPPKCER